MICNSYKPIFYSHGIERLIYNLMEIKCLKKAGTGQQIHHQDIQRMWRNLCAPGTRLKMKMLAIFGPLGGAALKTGLILSGKARLSSKSQGSISQGLEHCSCKPGVVSSNLAGACKTFSKFPTCGTNKDLYYLILNHFMHSGSLLQNVLT